MNRDQSWVANLAGFLCQELLSEDFQGQHSFVVATWLYAQSSVKLKPNPEKRGLNERP